MNHVRSAGFGDLVGRSFGLYYRNFPVLCGIYLLPSLPVGLWGSTVLPSDGPVYGVATAVGLFVGFIVVAALTLAVSEICIGNRPAVMATYRCLAEKAGPVIWTTTLVCLNFGVALVIFGLAQSGPDAETPLSPTVSVLIIIFATTYLISTTTYFMFSLNATVLERVSGIEAMKRSIHLVRGFFWRNVGVAIITLVPVLIAGLLLTFGKIYLYGIETIEERSSIASALIDTLVFGITAVPSCIAIVLLYYDCRVRKEQFDREQLAQGLAQ